MVTGDPRRVDGADRCADEEVRFDPGFEERLEHADLDGAKARTTGKHERHAAIGAEQALQHASRPVWAVTIASHS